MSKFQVVESSRQVVIPNVGSMLRVELQTEDGEVLGVEYRRPSPPESIAPRDVASRRPNRLVGDLASA